MPPNQKDNKSIYKFSGKIISAANTLKSLVFLPAYSQADRDYCYSNGVSIKQLCGSTTPLIIKKNVFFN
jgi:hypothetical protein